MAVGLFEHGVTQIHPDELMKLYRTWEIWEDWGVPKGRFDYWWEHLIKVGFMYRNGSPLPGSVDALWELSDREYHIHLVTARLNKFRLHDQIVLNTVEWLRDYEIPYRSLTFTEDKDSIHGDAIIDDNIGNLINAPSAQRFLFPAPHNRNTEHIEVVGNYTTLREEDPWDHLLEVLT